MSPDWDGRISNTSMNQTLNAVLTKAWPHDGECETVRNREPRDQFDDCTRATIATGDRAFLPPSPRNAKHCRELTPASRRQDHAALSSASWRIRLVHHLRPSLPASNVRDDRDTPLDRPQDARLPKVICPTAQGESLAASISRFAGESGNPIRRLVRKSMPSDSGFWASECGPIDRTCETRT
jgi:hypothetical protein